VTQEITVNSQAANADALLFLPQRHYIVQIDALE